MDLTVYTQYYRCKTPDRQLEIDECLRRNLNHPGISKVVLFKESDAPPLPQATVELEVVESNTRITYAEWFRWVKHQGSGIGLLLNADIYLDEGLEHLAASFDSAETFLALTRYNPGHAGFHLNDYPHWTQDVWGVRADAELPESLLYASSFPLGFPGCDNRIAYVMWSHGFRVRNPCDHVRSVHLQASTARAYDKTSDRLYGGVSYVHPSLAPDEDAELEFTMWTRSQQRPAWVFVNQQANDQGVHQLRQGEAEVAQRFLDLQQFTGLAWVHEAMGSAHLQGDLHPFASEDTVFLTMPALLGEGVELQMNQATRQVFFADTTARDIGIDIGNDKFDFISLMTNNLYGPDDDNCPRRISDVMPALVNCFHALSETTASRDTWWCSGKTLQEFLHVDNLTEAWFIELEHVQPRPEKLQFLNFGMGICPSICKAAEAGAAGAGLQDEINLEANHCYHELHKRKTNRHTNRTKEHKVGNTNCPINSKP